MSDIKKVKQVDKINIGFVVDGVKDFKKPDLFHDSSFALMLATQELGFKVLLTESNNLKIVNNKVFAKFDEVSLKQVENNHLEVKSSKEFSLNSFDVIFARKDPPIDENFLSYAHMLLIVSKSKDEPEGLSGPLIINSPESILSANEKLYSLKFPDLTPQTIVTSKKTEILDFLNKHKEAVVKPLFDKGGGGVFYLNANLKNVQAIIDLSINDETRVALVQKYIPEVINGDKRIILLNGEPLGAVLRIPKVGEFRANMSRGASVKSCTLTKRDLEICETLKPQLVKDGLYFTGIDVVGDYLTEVNITSPTGLQEIERFDRKPLAKEIVKWAIETATRVKTVKNVKKFLLKCD